MKRATARVLVPALLLGLTVPLSVGVETSPPFRPAHNCAVAAAGHAACFAEVVPGSDRRSSATSTVRGLTAADLRSAYSLSPTAGSKRVVAVIVAFDDPTAESDLAVYRSRMGLPACTRAGGCFTKVGQNGGTRLPKADAGWAGEASLDIEMVSAACTGCRILLVEANTSAMSDLAAAVGFAATRHVSAISNSYGSTDYAQTAAYNHPGIAIVAAAGDRGYGSGAPASFAGVIAVGGTTLTRSKTARGWGETAWSGGGSLCSTRNAKPGWQGAATACRGKAVTDVSAVADPATGVAAYAGTPYGGVSGWQVFGGTSAAAPIIAGIYAMSGNTAGYPASWTWSHRHGLNDVTTGSNGRCSPAVWCTAATGWDGPTGLGTPRGTTSF